MNTILLIGKYKGVTPVNANYQELKIEVRREFKEENGEYATDIFPLLLPSYYAQIIIDCTSTNKLKFDDIICIQGRLCVDDEKVLFVIVHKLQLIGASI